MSRRRHRSHALRRRYGRATHHGVRYFGVYSNPLGPTAVGFSEHGSVVDVLNGVRAEGDTLRSMARAARKTWPGAKLKFGVVQARR